MARNQRLHDSIRQAGRRYDEIAEALGTDPKTVGRWVTEGRLPRPAHRRQLAQLVHVPEAVLWPNTPGVAYGTSELIGIYTTRRELAPATITALLDAAERHIDVLAYAALWLWDSVPGFAEKLELKIAQGTSVRLCLGDPSSPAVLLRGQEEGVEDRLAVRCQLAIDYARPIHHVEPNTVRISDATLYATILRFDDHILLNTHLWGNPASASPVFHFRHEQQHGIAAGAIGSFERVWENAQPAPDG